MNTRQRVKICGISDPETARVAAEAGTDYIGINFYPGSHRYIDVDVARDVANATRSATGGRTQMVGLFVNEPLEEVLKVREATGLDIVQISGDEPAEYLADLSDRQVAFIATVRAGGTNAEQSKRRFREVVEQRPCAVILDTHVPGKWGGSGVVGDWKLAGELASEYRLFLAGGLDPDNVASAVREVRPYVVDVSSGVETNKRKDHAKIRAFIAAARGTEGSQQ